METNVQTNNSTKSTWLAAGSLAAVSGKCCLGEVRAKVEEIRRVSCARGHQTQNQGRREEPCALPTRN